MAVALILTKLTCMVTFHNASIIPCRAGNVGKLFNGEHTRKVKVSTPSAASGGIMMFAVKKRGCLGCKVWRRRTENYHSAHHLHAQVQMHKHKLKDAKRMHTHTHTCIQSMMNGQRGYVYAHHVFCHPFKHRLNLTHIPHSKRTNRFTF